MGGGNTAHLFLENFSFVFTGGDKNSHDYFCESCRRHTLLCINRVRPHRDRLVLGLLAALPSRYLSRQLEPTQPGLPPWVGAMSTGDGFGQHWGRNGASCPPR